MCIRDRYTKSIKGVEEDIQTIIKRVNELTGIKESDTGLAPPALWDLAADKQTLQNEQPLQVCFGFCFTQCCTSAIKVLQLQLPDCVKFNYAVFLYFSLFY